MIALAGCFNHSGPHAEALHASRGLGASALPLPTKDEVALVNGRPFSLSGFYSLQSLLNHSSTEAVLWVGSGALALQNETQGQGHELSPQAAIQISRYAIGDISFAEAESALQQYQTRATERPTPHQLKLKIEQLLLHSVVHRNNQLLAALNQP